MTLYGLAVLSVLFGVGLALADALLLALTPALLRRVGELGPARRPASIAAVRFAPVIVALSLVGLVSLPAWLRHEPVNSGETLSLPLLAAALLSLLPVLAGLRRGIRMFLRTRDRLRFWRRQSKAPALALAPFEIVEVKSGDLSLCVGGYLRPTIYASTDVMRSLEPEEWRAALAHEVSHATTRDPLRRLGMEACPDFLQLLGLDKPWAPAFARACEFAADARASDGRPEVALDLASALVKVARLQSLSPESASGLVEVAVSPAFSSRIDLQARIEALANPPTPDAGANAVSGAPFLVAAALIVVAGMGGVASEPVHELTETVGRLLSP